MGGMGGGNLVEFGMARIIRRTGQPMAVPKDEEQPVPPHDVTELRLAWRAGGEGALSRLMPLVCDNGTTAYQFGDTPGEVNETRWFAVPENSSRFEWRLLV